MRFVMYRDQSQSRLGVLHGENVTDLQALAKRRGEHLPGTLIDLIDLGEEGLNSVRSLMIASDGEAMGGCSHHLDRIELLAPLDPPRGNVVCVGRNYQEHAAESARARGEEIERPTVFSKAQTSINGPYGDVPVDPRATSEVDWEAELGVIIGRRGVNIQREHAIDYVFGYTVVNDVSARDVQYGWGGQFFKGKSFDGFCPIGPWIVTRDEVPDPQNVRVRLRVNGATKQDSSTADMIFPVDELIAQLSQGMTLLPGTLIATGTPPGVAMGRTPQEYLKDGDVMEAEVEGIGTLRNRIVYVR
ncbi:MAG: fumarylacetoacetate hydrolase family protein [Chloroflexota bacterium]